MSKEDLVVEQVLGPFNDECSTRDVDVPTARTESCTNSNGVEIIITNTTNASTSTNTPGDMDDDGEREAVGEVSKEGIVDANASSAGNTEEEQTSKEQMEIMEQGSHRNHIIPKQEQESKNDVMSDSKDLVNDTPEQTRQVIESTPPPAQSPVIKRRRSRRSTTKKIDYTEREVTIPQRKKKEDCHVNKSWEERVEELIAFKTKHGESVDPGDIKGYSQLSRWMSTQQQSYAKMKEGKKSVMTKSRLDRLKNIGFDFVKRKRNNNSKKKDVAVKSANSKEDCSDRQWNKEQITNGQKCKHALDEPKWIEKFNELIAYKDENEGFTVSMKTNKSLANWVYVQRKKYKAKRLNQSRLDRLKGIGFDFEPQKSRLKKTTKCKTTLKEAEDSRKEAIPQNDIEKAVKSNLEEGNISDDNIAMELKNQAGVDILDARADGAIIDVHNEGVDKYVSTKKMSKDAQSEEEHFESDESDAVDYNQEPRPDSDSRSEKNADSKSKHAEKMEKVWMKRFNELVAYKGKSANWKVPESENKTLHNWERNQRYLYNKSKKGEKTALTQSRIDRLDGIWFDFSPPIGSKIKKQTSKCITTLDEAENSRKEAIPRNDTEKEVESATSNNASAVATTVACTNRAVAQGINDNDDMSDILSVGTIKDVPIDIDNPKQQQQSYIPQQQTVYTPSPSYPSQYMYCEHCETAANCHNHRYGSFLEKKFGDINETGPLDHMEMYKKFVETYSTLREFHMSEEESDPSNILVSLPLCIYGGAFRKCRTKHITAAINHDHVRTNRTTTGGTASRKQSLTQDSCSTTKRKRRAPTSKELNSHSQWVATRSASVKRARKFK
jgi:hypothetical protein